MIGAMAHILNRPVLNHKQDLVIDGHGLIQPRVGISLEDIQKVILLSCMQVLEEKMHIQMQYQIYIKIILKKEYLLEKEFMICQFFQQF